MDLLVVQLKAAIRRLLDTKGVRGRVLDKVNRYGEVVIGVILERPEPAPIRGTPHQEREETNENQETKEREEPDEPEERDAAAEDSGSQVAFILDIVDARAGQE